MLEASPLPLRRAARGAAAAALLGLAVGACADEAGLVEIARLAPGRDPAPAAALAATEYAVTGSRTALAAEAAAPSWWRLVPRPGPLPRVLAVHAPYSAEVTAYLPPDHRPQRRTIYDRDLPAHHSRRALVFALATTGSEPLYLRVTRSRGYPLRVAVSAEAAYAAADLTYVRALAAVQTALVAVAVVALLFWLLLRERIYALFAANLLAQALFLAVVAGEVGSVPGLAAFYHAYGARSQWITAVLAFATALVFLREFGALDRYAPWPARAMGACVWVFAALLGLIMLGGPAPAWLPPLINVTVLASNLLAMLALGLAVVRGGRAARFVLAAWLPVLLAASLRSIQLNAGLALEPWLEYSMPVALALGALVLTAGLADRMLALRRERDRTRLEVERDALTGADNRHGLTRRLRYVFDQARAEARPLALLFLDLDRFKRVNDEHGHALGDQALRAVVAHAREELRGADVLGRYGGEEFVAVLPGATLAQARAVAERIRANVERGCAAIDGRVVRLTVSIGVVEARWPDDTPERLLARADAAMYAAKRAGRNRVESAALAEAATAGGA